MNTIAVCGIAAVCLSYAMVQGFPFCTSPIDTNDADVQAAATFAMRELGSEYTLLEVTTASRQAVAGYKHSLEANDGGDMADGVVADFKHILEANDRGDMTDGIAVGFKHIFEANVRRDMADRSKKFYSCTFETVKSEWKNYNELTKMCCHVTDITPAPPALNVVRRK